MVTKKTSKAAGAARKKKVAPPAKAEIETVPAVKNATVKDKAKKAKVKTAPLSPAEELKLALDAARKAADKAKKAAKKAEQAASKARKAKGIAVDAVETFRSESAATRKEFEQYAKKRSKNKLRKKEAAKLAKKAIKKKLKADDKNKK